MALLNLRGVLRRSCISLFEAQNILKPQYPIEFVHSQQRQRQSNNILTLVGVQ